MSKKSLRMRIGVVALAITMMSCTMSAFAATDFSGFSFSLPDFNGSKHTAYQKKTTTGATGEVEDYKSGAKANVDARNDRQRW